MRLISHKSFLIFPALLLVWGVGFSASQAQTKMCGTERTYPLKAGQSRDAGSVRVANDATNIYLKVDLSEGWKISESHTSATVTAEELPKSPGQFDVKDSYDNLTDIGTIVVARPDTNCGVEQAVAFHAVVQKEGEVNTETAWAGDKPIPGGIGWSNYMDDKPGCCDETPGQTGDGDTTGDQDIPGQTGDGDGKWVDVIPHKPRGDILVDPKLHDYFRKVCDSLLNMKIMDACGTDKLVYKTPLKPTGETVQTDVTNQFHVVVPLKDDKGDIVVKKQRIPERYYPALEVAMKDAIIARVKIGDKDTKLMNAVDIVDVVKMINVAYKARDNERDYMQLKDAVRKYVEKEADVDVALPPVSKTKEDVVKFAIALSEKLAEKTATAPKAAELRAELLQIFEDRTFTVKKKLTDFLKKGDSDQTIKATLADVVPNAVAYAKETSIDKLYKVYAVPPPVDQPDPLKPWYPDDRSRELLKRYLADPSLMQKIPTRQGVEADDEVTEIKVAPR